MCSASTRRHKQVWPRVDLRAVEDCKCQDASAARVRGGSVTTIRFAPPIVPAVAVSEWFAQRAIPVEKTDASPLLRLNTTPVAIIVRTGFHRPSPTFAVNHECREPHKAHARFEC